MNAYERTALFLKAKRARTIEELLPLMTQAGFKVECSAMPDELSAPEQLAVKRELVKTLRDWSCGESGEKQVEFGT